jgi:zinc/manganese transport system substrate-binding protein
MKLQRKITKRTSRGRLSAPGWWITITATCLLSIWHGTSSATIRVAASIPDLASIAASVGGDQVECFAICRPTADVHHVEVLPSYMVRVSKADVYLKVGMQLDQWADYIIDGSRNSHLLIVDCSLGINALEKPTEKVTALQGDVHPYGNPHYWLDPRNGAIIAREIAEELSRVDPEHAADYQAAAEAFAKNVDDAMAKGKSIVESLPGKELITYHSSWIYLAGAFGLTVVGTAEPVPGIPPTAGHLNDIVNLVQQRKIGVFIQEPYFSDDAGKFLDRETGLRVVKTSPSCDSAEPGSYLAHIHQILSMIAAPPEESDGR